MELESLARTDRYRISEILIVDPLDMSVLEPTDADVLTLITCYPISGLLPTGLRLVVHAEPLGE